MRWKLKGYVSSFNIRRLFTEYLFVMVETEVSFSLLGVQWHFPGMVNSPISNLLSPQLSIPKFTYLNTTDISLNILNST